MTGHVNKNGIRILAWAKHARRKKLPQDTRRPKHAPRPKDDSEDAEGTGLRMQVSARLVVLIRDGFSCAYCGAADVPLTMDHVTPRARGGTDHPDNLVPACAPCNMAKGSHTPLMWLYEMRWPGHAPAVYVEPVVRKPRCPVCEEERPIIERMCRECWERYLPGQMPAERAETK